MNVTFEGGTGRERGLVQYALDHLLNLSLANWNIDLTVTWVADPSAAGHDDLAATITDGLGTATMQLRNDLDVFRGYPEAFYVECVAHELGHLLTAHLSSAQKEQVAELFSTTVASIDDYTAESVGVAWEDRPFEGIAETFKDAFLRASDRMFTNRTNHRISISRYDDFRRIYRGGADGRFCYVYGGPDFRRDEELAQWNLTSLPLHRSDRDDEAFVHYRGYFFLPTGWGVEMAQFAESGDLPYSMAVIVDGD